MFGKKKPVVDEYAVVPGAPVAPLLEKFEGLIKEVLTELEEDIKKFNDSNDDSDYAPPLDENLVLRYVLAERGDKKAIVDSIRKAIEWRMEHREILSNLKLGEDGVTFSYGAEGSAENKMYLTLREGICSGVLPNGGKLNLVIQVNRPNHTKQKSLVKDHKPEDLEFYGLMLNEGCFRMCERRTRESGLFIMGIQIVDFKGYGLSNKEADRKFMQTMSKANSDFLHPKSDGKKFGINVPMALNMMLSAASAVKGKSGEPMVTIGSSKKNSLDLMVGKWPEMGEFGLEDALPEFLGGKAECPAFFNRV